MLHMFVGVPDDMLLDIGRLVVLAAQLDLHKMKLLEVANSVPVTESAKGSRKQLNKDIKRRSAWHHSIASRSVGCMARRCRESAASTG